MASTIWASCTASLYQGSSVMHFIWLKPKQYETALAKLLLSPFGLELPDQKIDSIGPVQRCFLSFPIHSKPDSPHIVLRRKVEVSVRNPLGVIYIILVILTQTSNYMSCFILLLVIVYLQKKSSIDWSVCPLCCVSVKVRSTSQASQLK